MSCEACEAFRDSGMTSFYRWHNANIEIRACSEHLVEVFDALGRARELQVVAAKLFVACKRALPYISTGEVGGDADAYDFMVSAIREAEEKHLHFRKDEPQ